MPRDDADPETRAAISERLYRLERGDTVEVSTTVDAPRVPELTVECVGKEQWGDDDQLYYTIHVTGTRGGDYVIFPNERPSEWASDWLTPELFHLLPDEISTRGNIFYVNLDLSAGDPP